MVYKIGNTEELSSIAISSDKAKEILYHFSRVLENEYGADRDVDCVGGYVLYVPSGTPAEEIRDIFDYSHNVIEYGEIFEDVCYAVYILGSDFGVVMVSSRDAMPSEIMEEIIKQKEI